MKRTTVLSMCAVLLTSCVDGTRQESRDSADRSRPPAAVVAWPSTEVDRRVADCVYQYPDDLETRAIAFDGTITKVHIGHYLRGPSATPVRLRMRVNEVFRGDLSDEVTLHTWRFMLPKHDVTGARLLAAAGRTMGLMGCGFTRPYSEADAEYWRQVFGS